MKSWQAKEEKSVWLYSFIRLQLISLKMITQICNGTYLMAHNIMSLHAQTAPFKLWWLHWKYVLGKLHVDEAYWNLMVFLLTTDVLLDVKDPKKGFDGMNFAGARYGFFNLYYFVSAFPYFAPKISFWKDYTLHWCWAQRTFKKLCLLVCPIDHVKALLLKSFKKKNKCRWV